ncbi:hypothetical protein TT01_09515 [Campylobacter jejuni]|uniref:NTP transferase domain-containing protein n=1 Tax=Campylobacter jejuni TaxID=197 RepID=A0A5Z0CFD8_CAMJU|nr:hypothetical protein [Campylobacter jejuni]EMC5234694.1 hypothetical protein [Campylobacter coli]EAH4565347.1 hypothetical protein [Campylobacter jejuni]EAH5071022.1 hypothetical protein [Campylobacter jejuni]EAH5336536.1 hypothetical protein [Campylobacter jejuni]EAH5380431.1 hypothetical protein [Campylobacter jejuni]
MNLILPVAGKSSRFPGVKPKWLLIHPNGNLMILEAIKGLNLSIFENIYVICLQEHYNKYQLEKPLYKQFETVGCENKLKIIKLKESTKSQPETVYQGIKQACIQGEIYIKDSDNAFVDRHIKGNCIATYDLNLMDFAQIANKSYIQIDDYGIVTNIIEKKVVSSIFCAGGYGFDSADEFCKYYEKLSCYDDLYISHIIYQMILDGNLFNYSKVENYLDWGTLKNWNNYKAQFASIFVDIDGVLLRNSDPFFQPMWGETSKIEENVDILNRLYDSGKVNIILITQRSLEWKEVTEKQLKKEGIKYHQIIYNLYHAKTIIINDYANSNPYKSCDSINLKRDSIELKTMLEYVFKL